MTSKGAIQEELALGPRIPPATGTTTHIRALDRPELADMPLRTPAPVVSQEPPRQASNHYQPLLADIALTAPEIRETKPQGRGSLGRFGLLWVVSGSLWAHWWPALGRFMSLWVRFGSL